MFYVRKTLYKIQNSEIKTLFFLLQTETYYITHCFTTFEDIKNLYYAI